MEESRFEQLKQILMATIYDYSEINALKKNWYAFLEKKIKNSYTLYLYYYMLLHIYISISSIIAELLFYS